MTTKKQLKIVYSVIKACPNIKLEEIQSLFEGTIARVTVIECLESLRKNLEISVAEDSSLAVFETVTNKKAMTLLERKDLFFKTAIRLKSRRVRLEPNWLVIMSRLKKQCPDDALYEAMCARYLRHDEDSPSLTSFYRYATTHGKRR